MGLRIGFLVFPDFQILDLSGPLAAFQVAGSMALGRPYQLRVVSQRGGTIASSSGLEVLTQPVSRQSFDTFFVVGGSPCRSPTKAAELADIVHAYAERSRRVASVCTGAYVLATAGLLDGRTATTHWRYAAALQRRFPRVRVNAERIFTRDGPIWTSAGTNAGIDLALAMIEQDLGFDAAKTTSQYLVVHHRRPGGQSQFAGLVDLEPESERIGNVLKYAREHLHERLSVERLADIACLSPRQFARAFVLEMGLTPAKAVERLRAEAARFYIETSREPIEIIARKVGFNDPERMRRTFVRLFGHPPQGVRRASRVA